MCLGPSKLLYHLEWRPCVVYSCIFFLQENLSRGILSAKVWVTVVYGMQLALSERKLVKIPSLSQSKTTFIEMWQSLVHEYVKQHGLSAQLKSDIRYVIPYDSSYRYCCTVVVPLLKWFYFESFNCFRYIVKCSKIWICLGYKNGFSLHFTYSLSVIYRLYM